MNSYAKKLKVWESAALIALSAALCAGAWAQGRQNSIRANLVRLHVVAVSDDDDEQALKLRVRDAVLAYLSPVLEEAEAAEDAKAIIGDHLEEVAQAARSASEGREVTVSLGCERFPTRRYEGFTLPAGEYDSLRVVLGEGQGHNWWCIVFPPVCVSAVQADRLQEVMNPEDLKIITEDEGYELKFKIVELWGELKNSLTA